MNWIVVNQCGDDDAMAIKQEGKKDLMEKFTSYDTNVSLTLSQLPHMFG